MLYIDRAKSTATNIHYTEKAYNADCQRIIHMIDKSTGKYPKRYTYEAVEGGVSIGVTDDEDSYITKRIDAYPPISDQLDALWKLIKANADKIDLVEAKPLLEAVESVKNKYPKSTTA